MCNFYDLELEFLFSFFCKELNLYNEFFFFKSNFFTWLKFTSHSHVEFDLYLHSYLDGFIFLTEYNIIEKKMLYNIDLFCVIKKNIRIDNYFEIKFFSKVTNFSLLEFISLQESIIVCPNEVALVFFRLFNSSDYDLIGTSLYFVYPGNLSIYVHKLQCFCFDLIKIKKSESIELPVLFYLDMFSYYESAIFDRLIYLSYLFFLR